MPAAGGDCTLETCPVSQSIYGYAPNLAANAVFIALFAVSALVHAYQGWRYKTWSFLAAMSFGCVLEAVGGGGRIMLHDNPFSGAGFKVQIVLLTFAPAFLAAGIYFTLKHIVLTFGQDVSRLPPRSYTHVFIGCDLLSIILQGTGGGLASGADNDEAALFRAGDGCMIAGLVFQVATLLVFGALAGEYAWRVRRRGDTPIPDTLELRASRRFRRFLVALAVSYSAILIRCVYRVAELAGGWGNSIMQQEIPFIVLDPVMCVIAALALNASHPGSCANHRAWRDGGRRGRSEKAPSSETGSESPHHPTQQN